MKPGQSANTTAVRGGSFEGFTVGELLVLTLSGPQSRFEDKLLEIRVVRPQNETAALKGPRQVLQVCEVKRLGTGMLKATHRAYIVPTAGDAFSPRGKGLPIGHTKPVPTQEKFGLNPLPPGLTASPVVGTKHSQLF